MKKSGLHTANYRPDIDGLRAVAVLAVVGYHFFPEYIPSGFVGVDIFFVISGFLIAGIILDDLAENKFSFRKFYARRIRRLFPALALVLLFTLALGWLFLFPEEFQALGKHVAGGAGFISNILYWRESGYFDADVGTKPLLHLWSLGIEEQFYLFFPTLLFLFWKKGFRGTLVIALLLFASLKYNFYLETEDRTEDFYSPLTRFWELLIGALLASTSRSPASFWLARMRSALNHANDTGSLFKIFFSITGFMMIAFSLLAFKNPPVWPGHLAIFPSLGAALILASGMNSFLNRHILGNPLAVAIGLISYPLYLWHWPIISYLYILSSGQPEPFIKIAGLVMALALAWLTYNFIEIPMRFGRRGQSLKTLCLLVFMFLAVLAGLFIYSQNGLPGRSIKPPEYETPPTNYEPCQVYTNLLVSSYYKRNSWCLLSNGPGASTVALIGDSHALSAYVGVEKINASLALDTLMVGREGGTLIATELEKDEMYTVLKRPEIKAVFIFLLSGNAINHSSKIQPAIDKLNMAGKKIFFVMDWPTLPRGGTSYAKRPYADFFKFDADVRRRELLRNELAVQTQKYFKVLQSLRNVTIVESWDAFCPQGECQVFSETGQLLYSDQHHLTNAGSEFLAEKVLAPYLRELAATQ